MPNQPVFGTLYTLDRFVYRQNSTLLYCTIKEIIILKIACFGVIYVPFSRVITRYNVYFFTRDHIGYVLPFIRYIPLISSTASTLSVCASLPLGEYIHPIWVYTFPSRVYEQHQHYLRCTPHLKKCLYRASGAEPNPLPSMGGYTDNTHQVPKLWICCCIFAFHTQTHTSSQTTETPPCISVAICVVTENCFHHTNNTLVPLWKLFSCPVRKKVTYNSAFCSTVSLGTKISHFA